MTSETAYSRPQTRVAPNPTAESKAFWTGGRDGQLLINRCHGCGHYFHPPGPAVWRCRSADVAPEPVSGKGTVAAYTVNRQPWIPGLDPPYVVAMVEFADEPDAGSSRTSVDVSLDDMHHVGLPARCSSKTGRRCPPKKTAGCGFRCSVRWTSRLCLQASEMTCVVDVSGMPSRQVSGNMRCRRDYSARAKRTSVVLATAASNSCRSGWRSPGNPSISPFAAFGPLRWANSPMMSAFWSSCLMTVGSAETSGA